MWWVYCIPGTDNSIGYRYLSTFLRVFFFCYKLHWKLEATLETGHLLNVFLPCAPFHYWKTHQPLPRVRIPGHGQLINWNWFKPQERNLAQDLQPNSLHAVFPALGLKARCHRGNINLSLCPSFSLAPSLLNFFTSLLLNQDKNRAITSNSQNVCNRCQNCKSLQTSILHYFHHRSESPMRKAVLRIKVGFKLDAN